MKIKFEKTEPTVLVIGAGQNGLMIAARLGALGIPTLCLDKNDNVGDSKLDIYFVDTADDAKTGQTATTT